MSATGADGPLEFRLDPATLVLQPTPLCNMRCTYCYLPDLGDRRRMDVGLSRLIADQLAELPGRRPIDIRWHAGEPLTAGVEHLSALLDPFESLRREGRVRHSIQTNATLINPEWCAMFDRFDVRIGVSIDGPRWVNRNRRTLSGAETFDRAMRGIGRLQEHGIRFSTLAVVSVADMPRIVEQAAAYLSFFDAMGTSGVGFNVEETEGRHQVATDTDGASSVASFWQALFTAWVDARCQPMVRDFSDVLSFAEASLAGQRSLRPVDLLPTVTCDGDVVVLSPELAGYRDERYEDFKAGNLHEEPLQQVLARATSLPYVQEFMKGTTWCRDNCGYYAYCRGGQASNRYFEFGDFLTSETQFCRHSRQMSFDAVLTSPQVRIPGAKSHA